MRLTSRASTSGSSFRSTGSRSTIASQYSRSREGSVAPDWNIVRALSLPHCYGHMGTRPRVALQKIGFRLEEFRAREPYNS